MFGLGVWELLIVLAIVVVLFGAKRLPLIGEGLGGMITNFKKATKKNKEEQAKIDDNSAASAEDNTVIKEDSTIANKENS
ncbi:MAG: twin-arginine translocase TatA/TatE family subunit [SAR324 cluster bacterium]|jgi:sec-independent protein translocase protein TatA|nr:twin-arginine translocase TatA/TatE family subunit [SAR324 cluster bacterium]|tara:strand:- start:1798 stop:2037 length:240 start_codon:yes stop_codon:yes gene_type:complete